MNNSINLWIPKIPWIVECMAWNGVSQSVICVWNLCSFASPSFCILRTQSGACNLAASISLPLALLTEKNQVLLFLMLFDSLCFGILYPLSVKGLCSVTYCPLYLQQILFKWPIPLIHAQMSPIIKQLLSRPRFLAAPACVLLFNTKLFTCISVFAVCTSSPPL